MKFITDCPEQEEVVVKLRLRQKGIGSVELMAGYLNKYGRVHAEVVIATLENGKLYKEKIPEHLAKICKLSISESGKLDS